MDVTIHCGHSQQEMLEKNYETIYPDPFVPTMYMISHVTHNLPFFQWRLVFSSFLSAHTDLMTKQEKRA